MPPEPTADRGVEPADAVWGGGRGAPLGPRAGWFCCRAMAVIELMSWESDAFWVVSLPVGTFCPLIPPKARVAVGVKGRVRWGPVGGVYAGRPVSAEVVVGARGTTLPAGRDVALSSE